MTKPKPIITLNEPPVFVCTKHGTGAINMTIHIGGEPDADYCLKCVRDFLDENLSRMEVE